MDLNTLKIFVEVVNRGSFSAASQALSMPVSTVSRKVSEFEEAIEQRLLERSTRNLRLTEAGETLYQYAVRSVDEMEAGICALEERQDKVEGILRIAIPPNFEIGWEAIKEFMLNYPKVKLQTLGITREVDPISDHIDIVVQYHASQNPSVVSRKIATMSPLLVASKDYVDRHGKPESISDLQHFQCLAREDPDVEPFWTLDNERFYFDAFMTTNEFSFLRFLVKHNFGVAQLPPYFCKHEVENGEFIHILPEVSAPKVEAHLVYQSRKHLSRVMRTFIDFSLDYAQNENPDFWQAK